MTPEEEKQLFQDTIDLWGERSQLEMLQEEATELALATRKFTRKPGDGEFFDLASEIADVEIMLEQLRLMLPSIDELVEPERKRKLMRLRKRVDEKRYEDAKS